MLKELEVLMVPPSQETCCIDHDLLHHAPKAKAVPCNQQQQQGRTSREGFDRGWGFGPKREDEEGKEPQIGSFSDDRILAPSSPPVAAAAACLSSPAVHEEVGCDPHKLHSMQMNSKDFPAHNGLYGESMASSREGVYTNGGPGPVPKENGFVGLSEKRMRNGETLASSSSSPSAGGKLSGESIPMGGRVFPADCPEEPLRKRVHVSRDAEVDVFVGRQEGDAQNGVTESEVISVVGVESPKKLDEGKTSDSEVKGGVTPARTEGNGEGGVEAEGRFVDRENDVEVFPETFDRNSEQVPVFVKEEILAAPDADDATDMEVDPNPITSNTIEVVAEEPVDEEELQQTGLETDAEAEAAVLSAFADVFEEAEGGSPSRKEIFYNVGSPDLNDLRPRDFDDNEIGNGIAQSDPAQPQPQPRMQRSIEVIEFDDSDDEEEPLEAMHESDGSSTKGKKPMSQHSEQRRRNGYRYSSSESTAPSNSGEDDSDSDDCRVVGSWRPPNAQYRQGGANAVVVEEDDDNYTTSEDSSDSSEVEEVAGSQSEIRRRWEEAAMRRRMGRAMQSAGSQLNGGDGGTINLDDDRTESQGLEESVATSTYRDSPDSKDQTETSEARGGPDGVPQRTGGPHAQATASRVGKEQRPLRRSPIDLNNGGAEAVEVDIVETPADSGRPNIDSSPDANQDDISSPPRYVRVETPDHFQTDRAETRSIPTGVQSESRKEEASSPSAEQNGGERWPGKHLVVAGLENEVSEEREVDAVGEGDEAETSTAAHHEDLLAAKERLKLTAHYRKADEAEWASRQLEIQRQALESKKLRLRKRQEADRKKEMERKQKERIEELRLNQMEEERNNDLRDRLRGQVRTELEQIAARCRDFATLLRELGIPVEGGSHPTPQQVNAAYKKALFKFHPDRAVASSQGEPRYQVEAEEKFKLIQRLKETLQPVATDYIHPAYRSFY